MSSAATYRHRGRPARVARRHPPAWPGPGAFQAGAIRRARQAGLEHQGNAALADYYWGSLADYEDGHFPNEERRLAKVSLQQANALAKRLFDGEGYLRIEKPLFDDDMLYPLLLAAGLLASGLLWFGLRRRRA